MRKALALCLVLTFGHVFAAPTDPDGQRYQPSENPLGDVQQALDRAKNDDRLVLVALGANWCHDSRALASRLFRPPLAELIEQHYELVFVDVGFLNKGRDVVQHFGVPHYYATPTVLIIDPSSGRLINNADRHQWSNAYKIDMPTSVRYFEKWLNREMVDDPNTESAGLLQLIDEIDAFERQLAERVAGGYAVVGPMLEAYKAGNAPDEFDARWDELWKFRSAIPADMSDLRDDARRGVSAGDQAIRILFPEYPPLSWESD